MLRTRSKDGKRWEVVRLRRSRPSPRRKRRLILLSMGLCSARKVALLNSHQATDLRFRWPVA